MVYVKLLLVIAIIATLVPFQRAQRQKEQIDYFLKKAGLQRKQYSQPGSRNGQLTNTNLDDFRDIYANIRNFQMQLYKQNEEFITKLHRQQGRLQPIIPETVSFPCDLNNSRSLEVPTSVNRLRPGDIDIIGALGDSLTAGTALLGDTLLQGLAEFRGVTFVGGGLKDWRTYLTLPNILKVFNPNLYGYAIGNTLARERPARFSVGEPLATTQDMPFQAHVLVKRLQMDPKVDMAKHWKLVTLFIGGNDVCSDMCHYDDWNDFLENHRKDMYKTLMILKTHVPRLMVNLLSTPNVQDAVRLMRSIPISCFAIHRVACNCVVSKLWNPEHLKKIIRTVKRVQQIDEELAALPEFQTEDFSVAYRSFTSKLMLNKYENGSTDLRYNADDCFHLSQFGNAAFAQSLWNSMVQGVAPEDKLVQPPFEKFQCPSETRPYIATLKNDLEEIK